MKTITLEVSEAVADKINQMTPIEKQAVVKTLSRIVNERRGLEEIMDEISEEARRKGMTPEILERILNEIDEESK